MAAKPPFDRLKAYKPMAIVNAPPHERKHLLRRFWFPAVLLLALAAGGLTGIIAAYELNYSRAANEVAALATYRPSVVTRVYADDGETVIGEFALEKRIPLKYEEIPPVMKNAILAVEDARFYDHIGIDPIRIMGAAWKNLTTDKVEGGSTLTQQLAKNLFLSKEQTYKRKVNEWVLALQIERYYTKNQIMELYANHIFLGANAYGVEAGAETYFGKQAKDLTLGEAALLAGDSESAQRLFANLKSGKGKRASRSGAGSDGQDTVLPRRPKLTPPKPNRFNLPTLLIISRRRRRIPLSIIRSNTFARISKTNTRRAWPRAAFPSTPPSMSKRRRRLTKLCARVLRRYDKAHAAGARPTKRFPPRRTTAVPTQQELNNYKHPDWYRQRL